MTMVPTCNCHLCRLVPGRPTALYVPDEWRTQGGGTAALFAMRDGVPVAFVLPIWQRVGP